MDHCLVILNLAIKKYEKGQVVKAKVLDIDVEKERVSLGIKQLAKDPFSGFVAENPRGSIVNGTVMEVDARGAIIDLGNGVEELEAQLIGLQSADRRQIAQPATHLRHEFGDGCGAKDGHVDVAGDRSGAQLDVGSRGVAAGCGG